MSSVASSVWDLWSETVRETETLGDPVLMECLEAAASNRIFEDLPDEKLKSSLSMINSLLNDPKTRPKGLTLLNELFTQVHPSRLIGYQDSVISALHLVVKGLESPLASRVLVVFLPKCHTMAEVNQSVTSSVIPKILSYFCENAADIGETSTKLSFEEIMILKICLDEYHGPCGQFRDKLEKAMVPLIDTENEELLNFISEVMPFLSYAGGGGTAGEKHSNDWNTMLTKFLKTVYSVLYQLYSSSCPTLEQRNPFEGEELVGLQTITESKVLLRTSLLKRRLHNLLVIISGYLRTSFPAPKHIPQKGILRLIGHLISVNPIDPPKTEISRRKEFIFLSAVAPGIHVAALNLLKDLVVCLGTNIFTDGVTVEQILASEFKWLQERPKAYENLRMRLYETLIIWLRVTGGLITNTKTLSLWTNAIGNDTRVEKDFVELKVKSKPKPGKSVKLASSSSLSMGATTTQTYVQKSSHVCQIALKALLCIIPSLDADNHKKIYEHLVKTISIISQFQSPPPPYRDELCRKLAYKNLSSLCRNPQPRTSISLALVMSLLRSGLQDPAKLVFSSCHNQISQLERLLHPVSAPLSLADTSAIPVTFGTTYSIEARTGDAEGLHENNMDVIESSSDSGNELVNPEGHNAARVPGREVTESDSVSLDSDSLRLFIKDVIQKTLKDVLPNTSKSSKITDMGSSMLSGITELTRNRVTSVTNKRKIDATSEDIGDSMENIGTFGRKEYTQINGCSDKRYSSHEDSAKNNEESEIRGNETLTIGKNGVNGQNSGEDEVERNETNSNVKRTKTVSSLKPIVHDGPSVEEMLASFVESDPIV